MEKIQDTIWRIDANELLPVIMEKKNDFWRLGQICCVFVDGQYEISYSFCKDYELENYRLVTPKDVPVPSISRVFQAAHFYENEMVELFGCPIEHQKVDLENKLYRINETTPFVKGKEEA